MSSEIILKIVDPTESGSDFQLILPNVRGLYNLTVNGYFNHTYKRPKWSEWELYQDHLCNGRTITTHQLEQILGDGCRDVANERLETVLGPALDADFQDWSEWIGPYLEQKKIDEAYEAGMNASFYQSQKGVG